MDQRIIGLTGGIATGKSTVAHYLEHHHGIPVLDADVFARRAVAPGSAGLAAIVQRYGAAILNAEGTLDRRRLGAIVFPDDQERAWLEQQIHPAVRRQFIAAMEFLAEAPTVVQVIPLLFEANLTDQVTEIWVVACPEAVELARLMARDGLSAEAARTRIKAQWPLGEKTARADMVLDNSGDQEALFRQVDHALGPRQSLP